MLTETDFDSLLAWEADFDKQALTSEELAAEAAKVDPEPTDKQKAVGNYAKGHVKWNGLPITIETAAGAKRSGVGADGKPWSVVMADHYGYIVNHPVSEADGDHVDVFLSDETEGGNLEREIVFVVNQQKPDGTFDEHKVVLGESTAEDAKALYLRNYAPGWKGFMSVTAMTVPQFKRWLKDGDKSVPLDDDWVFSRK